MKVLILHYGTAGDVIFSTPLVRALKIQLDDAEVHYATSSQGVLALEENPYIDKVYSLENSNYRTRLASGKQNFDAILDLNQNSLSIPERFLLKGAFYKTPGDRWKNWLMVNLKINKLSGIHIADVYIETARTLGIKKDDLGLDYFIPEKDEVPVGWLPEIFHGGYVAVCISARYPTRKLPVARIIELCDKINKPIMLLGQANDDVTGKTISTFFERTAESQPWEEGLKALNKKTVVYNACGKFSFHQMASVVKQARCVFTFDNDFIAIASAFKKEIFSIWGNTIPLSGRYPYNTRFTVLENNRIPCRPCSTKGFSKCPKGHFKCMNDIVFDFYV